MIRFVCCERSGQFTIYEPKLIRTRLLYCKLIAVYLFVRLTVMRFEFACFAFNMRSASILRLPMIINYSISALV